MQGGAWGSLGSPLDSQFFSSAVSCLAGTGGLCPTITGPTSFDKLTQGIYIGASVNQQPPAHGTHVMTQLWMNHVGFHLCNQHMGLVL
jgi:hypothetical protein